MFHKFTLQFFFLLSVYISFLFACRTPKTAYPKFLSQDSLPLQSFDIDNSRDTSLRTANGALIKIAKGSFSKERVQLQIKEAYSLEQMVLAGLTTESNGKPLRSGGMIYLHAEGEEKLLKPISVSIPATNYDDRMQLYTGEEKDGKINWINPQPIIKGPSLLDTGRTIFRQNCASCHVLDKIVTGPALLNVEERGPWYCRQALFDFTRHPAAFIPTTQYTSDQQKQFGTIMPGFPSLSDKDLNALYDYIKNEGLKDGDVQQMIANSKLCEDSCAAYDSLFAVVNEMSWKRQQLIQENGYRINFEKSFNPEPIRLDSSDYVDTAPASSLVHPITYQSVYYQFNIKTLNWYNVDFPLLPIEQQAELKVKMQGNYRKDMNVFLIVEQYRIFGEGGPLDDGEDVYGFYSTDGKISMPPGLSVIVFAVGESEGKISFDWKEFVSTDQQTIILEPKLVSKREFNRTVKSFRLDNSSIHVVDSKNAKQIRKADQKLKKGQEILELYRPKNCHCSCAPADTLMPEADVSRNYDYNLDTANRSGH
ncbi:MAG: c-type cytochrome [Flavisolibacter sp.]